MRKVIVFLYFVFIFKLAFANSLPSINVFGDEKLSNIEPASGMQVAQNNIPELPSMQDSASAPLPEDFNLPTLDSEEAKKDEATQPVEAEVAAEEFESPALPPTAETGAVPAVAPAEVADMPTLPDQLPETPQAMVQQPVEQNNDADNINIDQIISESSVREQFPETPELNKTATRKSEEESKVIPISAEERAEEVDSLLNEVFDKDKTPEQLAAEKKEIEKDNKLKEELSNKEQLDLPIMEDVVSVDEQNIQPLESLSEFSDDSEQLPLDSMPDSMKDNYQPQIANNGKIISTSNTYSEQRLSELLVTASMRGDKRSVIDLINSGRSPNSQNQFGETALMGAIYSANNEIIEILLSEGADVNLADNKGNTPLIVAAARNNVQAVQQLTKAGADIDISNNASDNPILVAALKNHNQVLDILVRQGGDINKANAEGLTALHIAAYNDNPQLVGYLLNLGANPNVVAKGGYKPYDLLRDKNSQSAQLLVAYANDMQKKMEAQKMAFQLKEKNADPIAKNIYANADQYAIFPRAYSEAPEQKPESKSIPKSDWWAAKNIETQKAAPQQQIMQAPRVIQQNIAPQITQVEDFEQPEISQQKPASIAFREMIKPQSSAQQFPVANTMQKSAPVDTVEVQTLSTQENKAQGQTTQKTPSQPKQWRRLTVDQASINKEQDLRSLQPQTATQQQATLPAQTNNQQVMVRAVYDDNGNIVSQQNIGANIEVNPSEPTRIEQAKQPKSFALNNLAQNINQTKANAQVSSKPLNQMQVKTISQTQQQTSQIMQVPNYNQLDSARKQAWDLRLQEWVRSGIFMANQTEAVKANWLAQQKIFQSVYQDQFNIKVDSIKKQITGGINSSSSQSRSNNYYGQQSFSQQGAMVTSYALGQAPLSQTF